MGVGIHAFRNELVKGFFPRENLVRENLVKKKHVLQLLARTGLKFTKLFKQNFRKILVTLSCYNKVVS
jgi:hypothetical protein